MVGEVRNGPIDGLGELIGDSGLGQAAEVGGKHGTPVEADLSRTCLICEDHIVGCFVDMAQQPEERFEGLADGTRWRGVGRAHALAQKPVELGGIKSLYSHGYYDPETFWRIYDRETYRSLKARYDPDGLLGDLYRKCVLRE
jgi:hypothetical protein